MLGSSPILIDVLSGKYNVICYGDNNQERIGQQINDLDVYGYDKVKQMISTQDINALFIAIADKDVISRVCDQFSVFCDLEIDYYDSDIYSDMEEEYLNHTRESLVDKWDVCFADYADNWVNNLESECLYWKNNNKTILDRNNEIWQNNRFDYYDKSVANHVSDGSVVYDIGCGPLALYGSKLDAGEIDLISVDPLSFLYNKISARPEGKEIKFGMFEFIADFFESESADLILINNALDHCIDPYKSVLESLALLKTGGKLRLVHRRAEAVHELYTGLHKWNIDYNADNNLIFWNKNNMINVTKALENIADIQVTSAENVSRENDFIQVMITKKKSFDLFKIVDSNDEIHDLTSVIRSLMHRYMR